MQSSHGGDQTRCNSRWSTETPVGTASCLRTLAAVWVVLTSAVPEVSVARRVVLAEPLQDLLVVHEPVQRAQEEGVEWQVTHLLQLKVSAEMLQPPGALDGRLQCLQGFTVLPQVGRQVLREEGETVHTSVTQETVHTSVTFVLIILLQLFYLSDETTGQALLVTL